MTDTSAASTSRIAVVWDDRDIAALFAYFLGAQGYVVTSAHTLGQGLTLCVNDPPDLLIVPRRFDDKSDGGLELCHQLRMIAELPRFPIIVGENEPGLIKQEAAFQQAFDAGANACFGRVWQSGDVLEMIEILLANPSTTNLIDRQSARMRQH